MIFNSVEITEDGYTFKRLTNQDDFWACAYDPDTLIIRVMTEYDEEAEMEGRLKCGNVADGPISLDGFGCVGTYEEFTTEIESRGLIYPS